jgi:hypothetical protein
MEKQLMTEQNEPVYPDLHDLADEPDKDEDYEPRTGLVPPRQAEDFVNSLPASMFDDTDASELPDHWREWL